jgi:hypothetical protein
MGVRWIFFLILLLALSCGGLAEEAPPLCVRDPAQMPGNWRPPAEVQKRLNPAPWSRSEAKDAEYAIETGLDEMIDFFERRPSAVQALWDDSIEALIQVTYSSANKPEFDAKVRNAARNNLTALVTPYLDPNVEPAVCSKFERLLPLALFAHRLYPANDARTDVVTKRANAAYRACGSLKAATGYDLEEFLADEEGAPETFEETEGSEKAEQLEDLEDLFDLSLWSLWLIEAELYPEFELPVEARNFGPKVWKYFETYRLDGASEYEKGATDAVFFKIADLATHIAHIPTGVHRFPLYVDDWPGLYRFLRENYYSVMQAGDLDLFASFVDSLRQYGCTAENDAQVRDGTRHLLKVFHDSDDRWMDYQQAGQSTANVDGYRLIHHPWTAVLGIRARKLEAPSPGTYGGIVRRWLPPPHRSN